MAGYGKAERCGYCGYDGCPECVVRAVRPRSHHDHSPDEQQWWAERPYDDDAVRIPTTYVMIPMIDAGFWGRTLKYGVTSAPDARIDRLNDGSLQQWEYLRTWTMGSMDEAYRAEERIGQHLRSQGAYPMATPQDMPAGGFSETFHWSYFDDLTFDEELVWRKGEWGPGRPRWSTPISAEEWQRRRRRRQRPN